MRSVLLGWMIGACALLQGAQAQPLYTDDNMPAALVAELMRAQDLAMELRFAEAETIIRGIMQQEPEHPLGDVFLLATQLSRTQEEFRGGRRQVDPALIRQAEVLIEKAKVQQSAYPHSAYPRYYMAAGLGVRGLARLYAGSYISSYRDGKRGAALLKEAVAIKPELYNAYMGLGQFEYYCGTLGSVLQFLLALPGDPDQGLAMLKTCADQATYAAWPCRAFRVRLIVGDRKDYAAVEPELPALVARYPGNYDFALATFAALDAKVNTAALRNSAEDILRRERHGWAPPAHARFDPQAAALSLALAYLEASQRSNALPHLEAVSRGPRKDLAQRAQDLLARP